MVESPKKKLMILRLPKGSDILANFATIVTKKIRNFNLKGINDSYSSLFNKRLLIAGKLFKRE
ncbi:hypothetical protein [Candidatus Ichthyocystis sparus]|uniref:hypothetical protein n=1 Tax=Candidatus Ichthyocystis sparus TaxID=1561004 RepID=UPI000B89D0F6|nr:hypothetical protein [Candidatus Ichthyocystis sparus]